MRQPPETGRGGYRVLEGHGGDGPDQSGIHPRHGAHFRPHRQIQRDGWRPGDGASAHAAGDHSTIGPHLRGCAPIHRRTAALAASHGGRPPLDRNGQIQEQGQSDSGRRHSIRWKGRFNSATSRWIRRPDRSSCGLSSPTRKAFCCRACSSGRWWRKASIEQAILIPQQAVSRDPKGNPFALIVDAEGKVQQRPLTLDRAIGDQWLVSSGLAAGDRVIVEGMQKVRPGASVKAVPFDSRQRKDSGEHKNAARRRQNRTDGGA